MALIFQGFCIFSVYFLFDTFPIDSLEKRRYKQNTWERPTNDRKTGHIQNKMVDVLQHLCKSWNIFCFYCHDSLDPTFEDSEEIKITCSWFCCVSKWFSNYIGYILAIMTHHGAIRMNDLRIGRHAIKDTPYVKRNQ